MPDDLQSLTEILLSKRLMVATAESCTAGLAAKLLTDQAGSSQWFERGFITYSNAAKQEMLGVSKQSLDSHGAVSEQIVIEMARGALSHSHADVALAISGIAGPEGGSDDKPVGTVWFAWVGRDMMCEQEKQVFAGDRDAVRRQAADHAIRGMLKLLSSETIHQDG